MNSATCKGNRNCQKEEKNSDAHPMLAWGFPLPQISLSGTISSQKLMTGNFPSGLYFASK